jgi:hypothetical protein
MKAPAKSDSTLWLSRVSFLVSAVALVSVGYRSFTKRFQGDEEATVAAAADLASKPPLLVGLAQHTLSGAALRFSHSSDHGALSAAASSSKSKRTERETLGSGFKAQAANLGVRVKRLVVTQAVEGREPVETSEVSSSTPVIAFVEVATDGREDQNVVVTFEHETGDRVGLVNLNVPGNKSRWRTWGRTYDVNRDGRWTAVVRDSRGEELGRTAFTVRGTS